MLHFRAGVALVHVDVEVTSGRWAAAEHGFEQADFRVLDDAGKAQQIVNFSTDEQPLDLILLFDVSGSMRDVVGAGGRRGTPGATGTAPGRPRLRDGFQFP